MSHLKTHPKLTLEYKNKDIEKLEIFTITNCLNFVSFVVFNFYIKNGVPNFQIKISISDFLKEEDLNNLLIYIIKKTNKYIAEYKLRAAQLELF